jgi:nucleoside-diphosphate-sugar epimerase
MKNNCDFLNKDVEKILYHIDFSEMRNKKILVTGGTGLVGLYFLLSLKNIFEEYNINITVIHKNPIESYLYDFIDFNKITCVNIDLTIINEINDKLSKYDYIIHAAGYGQPVKFLENQIKTLELNSITTLELIKKLNPGGKFLFMSSSEVYSGLDYEQSETEIGTTTPNHSRACYIEGKRCGETICNIYRKNGVDAKSIRLSLTYGPSIKVTDDRMMSNFIKKSVSNNKIEMLDSGDTVRSYIYVTDAIIMCWNILFKGKFNVYNVGGTEVYSVYDIAQKIGEIFNIEVIRPVNDDQRLTGSPKFVNVKLDQYFSEFNKFPFETISDGLNNIIHWYKKIYNQ